MTDLHALRHPAHPLLQHLSKRGFPVVFSTPPWTPDAKDHAMARGPHRSAHEFLDFLREELADMVERATWMVVLPYDRLRKLQHLRLSPMRVISQHARQPRPIVNYSFSGVNRDTVPLCPQEAMQFGALSTTSSLKSSTAIHFLALSTSSNLTLPTVFIASGCESKTFLSLRLRFRPSLAKLPWLLCHWLFPWDGRNPCLYFAL
jgi:hypothetical protein